MKDRELIEFGMWLTGHDRETVKQMLEDFRNRESIFKQQKP